MATSVTETLTITIDADPEKVSADLADPTTHSGWATEFFAGPVEPAGGDEYHVQVPRMGGPVRMRVEADVGKGIVDLYLAPVGADFGPPLPVRLVQNGDGVDVLWTLARPDGLPDEAWEAGLASMRRELENLRRRHEAVGP